MNRLFLDANIVIDILLERDPWMDDALRILSLADRGEVELSCSTLSLGTASYLMENRKFPHDVVIRKLNILCGYCEPAKVDAAVVRRALDSSFSDFEDAMQYFAAIAHAAEAIITRNKADFSAATVPVYTPSEFLMEYSAGRLQ